MTRDPQAFQTLSEGPRPQIDRTQRHRAHRDQNKKKVGSRCARYNSLLIALGVEARLEVSRTCPSTGVVRNLVSSDLCVSVSLCSILWNPSCGGEAAR